ncbi:MAG: hypothetical protein EOO47_07040 [Flavobacterium sp.]|nr:MAG: hypothetical protein EOO47_07040 [Flavobacterium sp.]
MPSFLFAQQRSIIKLIQSTSMKVDTKTNINYVKNPVFQHDNAILTCDSAVFYKERNFFEAYKNVHINQGDTVNIYSDFLDYDGNKKIANLNSNVQMIDATSTLTTNKLIYFMDTKIGRYVDGGKIVNKEVTITSKNAWYFSNSRDAWFRYNVVVVTPESVIKSDTLRYNTLTAWTYFYGPTNIKGKDDNLYTENGSYNTRTENAFFGKRNLYTQGTKSLKGDSLFYNGKIGYGKAIKNIVFKDTSDKMILYGQLGEYYKADERIVVTQDAYFGMDTKDSVTINDVKRPDTLWLGADTLEAQKVLQQTLKLLVKPVVVKDNEIGLEEEKAKAEKEKEKTEARKLANATDPSKPKKEIATLDAKDRSKKSRKSDKKLDDSKKPDTPLIATDSVKKELEKIVSDSLKIDSAKALIKQPIITKIDSTKDSIKPIFPNKDVKKMASPLAKNLSADSTKKLKLDSAKILNPLDTTRTRVIKAFHNVRVYKSNMQATADSLFYTSADSALRWYKNPMLWGEGSQQTGDTIHVFFKGNKLHSFQVLQNGYIVNVETDSTKFNQVKGTIITGFFTDGSLKNMYVDGNAESIYYTKNNKDEYDHMNQSLSSRIRFTFDKKELTDIVFIKEGEGATYPIDKLPKETTLTGFIWKPELRPKSKAEVIKGKSKPKTPAVKKPATTTKKTITPDAKATTGKPVIKPKTATQPVIDKPKIKVLDSNAIAKPTVKADTIKKATEVN